MFCTIHLPCVRLGLVGLGASVGGGGTYLAYAPAITRARGNRTARLIDMLLLYSTTTPM